MVEFSFGYSYIFLLICMTGHLDRMWDIVNFIFGAAEFCYIPLNMFVDCFSFCSAEQDAANILQIGLITPRLVSDLSYGSRTALIWGITQPHYRGMTLLKSLSNVP